MKTYLNILTATLSFGLHIAVASDFAVVKNLRYEMTQEAAKNLKAFNSSSTCDNWKETFIESLIGRNFKNAEEKREATIKVESVLKEITRIWDTHLSEESTGPAHQELFMLSSLKKDTNESYKKFYERKYNEHIEALKKIKEQFNSEASSEAFKKVNEEYRIELEKRIAIAGILKNYAISANKPVDIKKATWVFIQSQLQSEFPSWDQIYISKIVQGIRSFNKSVEILCLTETILKALPPDADHLKPESTLPKEK